MGKLKRGFIREGSIYGLTFSRPLMIALRSPTLFVPAGITNEHDEVFR